MHVSRMSPPSGRAFLLRTVIALAYVGCQMAEPDVVERIPDGGEVIDVAWGTTDADGFLDRPVDASVEARDTAPDRLPARGAGGRGGGVEGASDTSLGTEDASDAAVADSGPDGPLWGEWDGGGVDGADMFCLMSGYVFCDDFEAGATRWSTTGTTWTTSTIGSTANHVYEPEELAASTAWVTGAAWSDVTVEARVMVSSFGQAASANRAEVYARYLDATTFWALSLSGDGKLSLRKGGTAVGTSSPVADVEDAWHTLTIKVAGPVDHTTLEGYWDGKLKVTWTDSDATALNPVGSVGLGVYGATQAVFDDVRVSSP